MNEQLRRIVISGMVTEEVSAQFLEQITALEYIDVTKPISIYIDTIGGSVYAALCIYDAMRTCACPIVTIGIGKVMSAGVLLLASGDSRFITQNTRIMVHEISGGAIGSITELDNSIEEVHYLQNTYINLLSKDAGVSKTKLKEAMKRETYMSAKEAVEFGLADTVVPTRGTKIVSKTVKKNKKAKSTKKASNTK